MNAFGIRPPLLTHARKGGRRAHPPSRSARQRTGGLAFLAAALALTGHFRARPPRFGQPDGDRLFTAGDLLAGSAAAKRSALPLAHDLFDLLGRLFAVLSTATLLRHHLLLSVIWPWCLASAIAPYPL